MTISRSLVLGLSVVGALVATAWPASTAKYVGAKKCKTCHNKKTEVQQYTIWQESAHAGAYRTLGTDSAKELAAKAGVDGDPQQAKECLECHVAGSGEDSSMFAASFKMEDGVQCESCHGPGSKYKSTKIMSKKKYASQREEQHKLALAAGLTIPNEETCLKCHNERSPAYKEFDFKTFYEKIKHEYSK